MRRSTPNDCKSIDIVSRVRPIAKTIRDELSGFVASSSTQWIHRAIADFLRCHQCGIELKLKELFWEWAVVLRYVNKAVGLEHLG